jgi:5-methyltetrahydrofolate--homocysteine methyltransferase
MPICVQEQDARGLKFPVIVGGAAINRDFGRRIVLLDDGARFFEPGLFYAKDAFEGLELMDTLTSGPERRSELVERLRTESFAQRDRVPAPGNGAPKTLIISDIKDQPADVPLPPFWGARTLDDIALEEIWPHYDLRSLYRLSWGAANAKGDAFDTLVREEFEPRLERYRRESAQEGWLQPRAVYGYFPAAGVGNDAIIYDPEDPSREIARFEFARQPGGEHLSLADYLREPEEGRGIDVVALQLVTVGTRAGEMTEKLQAAGDYGESYFVHGFSVQAAEALAEATHHRIRRELGIPADRGKRYSWGYGACPDLSQHETLFRLLDVENRIGATLTSAYQIVPEQSTAAIVIHHPRASYFNAAAVREVTAV